MNYYGDSLTDGGNMKIVQKRADELKPGDILMALRVDGRAEPLALSVVCYIIKVSPRYIGGDIQVVFAEDSRNTFPAATVFDVLVDVYSPAQQHAEDLVETGRQIVAEHEVDGRLPVGVPASVRYLSTILNRIRPEPPTAQELAAALAELLNAGREQQTVDASMHAPLSAAAKIVERACAAGLL